MLGRLADDPRELAGCHGAGGGFPRVPELHDGLGPELGVRAAVERGELPGLDLGDVVAWRCGATVTDEHEGLPGSGIEDTQQLAQGHLVGLGGGGRLAIGLEGVEHVGYSHKQSFDSDGNMEERQALSAFGALSQETRLRILRQLVVAGADGLAAGVIAERVDTPASTLSFHLKELERAGLVTSRRESRSIIYSADHGTLSGLIRFLMEDCCSGRPEICAPATAAAGECAPASTAAAGRTSAGPRTDLQGSRP